MSTLNREYSGSQVVKVSRAVRWKLRRTAPEGYHYPQLYRSWQTGRKLGGLLWNGTQSINALSGSDLNPVTHAVIPKVHGSLYVTVDNPTIVDRSIKFMIHLHYSIPRSRRRRLYSYRLGPAGGGSSRRSQGRRRVTSGDCFLRRITLRRHHNQPMMRIGYNQNIFIPLKTRRSETCTDTGQRIR